MFEYKVWIHVEKYNLDKDVYEDLDGLCYQHGPTFATEKEAADYSGRLIVPELTGFDEKEIESEA